MTINEFLDKLKQTPRNWTTYTTGAIRQEGVCPVLHVCGRHYAETLGVTAGNRIALAADNSVGHDTALRAQLLDACGLSDPPVPSGGTQ